MANEEESLFLEEVALCVCRKHPVSVKCGDLDNGAAMPFANGYRVLYCGFSGNFGVCEGNFYSQG